MQKLNLPEYSFRIQKTDKGLQIFDPLRKKFLVLTPEEWVRQNFIQYMVHEKKYPASLIAVETGLKYNRLKKRSDIIVHDRKGNVWLIVECKAPQITISQKIFDQAAIYNVSGKTKAKYLAITNGLKHYCCEMLSINANKDDEQKKYKFLKNFPEFK